MTSARASLIRLPFRHYLTPNYDLVIEAAFRDIVGVPADCFDFHNQDARRNFLESLGPGSSHRSVVHVHGSIGEPQGIVLTLDDYNERYYRQPWAKDALTLVFTVSCGVFIGCGLAEEDLGPLRYLTATLGGGAEPKHFAIMEQPAAKDEAALQVRLRSRYRIEPVFYPQSENHQAILPFITQLLTDVQEYRRTHPQQAVVEVATSPEQTIVVAVLEQVLEDDPVKLAAARQQVPEAFQRATGRGLPTATPVVSAESGGGAPSSIGERTPLDDEIDGIFKYVQRGQPDVAIELYRQVAGREGNQLSPRLRYRIYANIGNAYYSWNQPEKAAEQYLLAAPLRDSREAKALEAQAYILTRNFTKAHELALKLCQAEPNFPRAYTDGNRRRGHCRVRILSPRRFAWPLAPKAAHTPAPRRGCRCRPAWTARAEFPPDVTAALPPPNSASIRPIAGSQLGHCYRRPPPRPRLGQWPQPIGGMRSGQPFSHVPARRTSDQGRSLKACYAEDRIRQPLLEPRIVAELLQQLRMVRDQLRHHTFQRLVVLDAGVELSLQPTCFQRYQRNLLTEIRRRRI